jgi:hypothetical protein
LTFLFFGFLGFNIVEVSWKISPCPEKYLEAEGEAPRREDDPTSRDSKLAAMDEDDPASLPWGLYLRPSCAKGGERAKDERQARVISSK